VGRRADDDDVSLAGLPAGTVPAAGGVR
jgi:hypothetical protein